MAHDRAGVIAALNKLFPVAEHSRITSLIDTYGIKPYERERERVQMAILNLSEGDEAKLQYFLAIAKQDYRDIIFWSDNPEEAKIDTPDKKRQMRELFAKLGLKCPIES